MFLQQLMLNGFRYIYFLGGVRISDETFEMMASKLQDELLEIIENHYELNDYELIMYKYVFTSQLNLNEVRLFEIDEDSFTLTIVPENLEFKYLRQVDDAFDKFELILLPDQFVKIKFRVI